MMDEIPLPGRKKKKKVDREALMSPFMRIPRLDIRAARLLLDVGLRDLFELQGRSPEVLFAEARKRNPDLDSTLLPHLRMAVYFVEADPPDGSRLHPHLWAD